MGAAQVLTRKEIQDAIESLSDADTVRLKKVAELYARLTDFGPDDLLQEAVIRALDGLRNCPANVSVVRFLAEAMRSIAFADRSTVRSTLIPIANHSNAPNGADPPDDHPNPEEGLQITDSIHELDRTISALFEDDLIAQTLIDGIREEMPRDDLMALTGLTIVEYESKRRLIRRRFAAASNKREPV